MADGLIDSLVHKACQTDLQDRQDRQDTDPRTCLEHVAKLRDGQDTDRTSVNRPWPLVRG